MNLKWNLDALYTDFDAQYEDDLKALKELIQDFDYFSINELSCNTEAILFKYIELNEKINTLSSKLYAFPALINSADTKNEKAEKYLDIIEQLLTQLTAPLVRFKRWLKDIDQLELLAEKNHKIKDNLFHLNEYKKETHYLLSDGEEVLISKLRLTGGEAWSKLHGKLTSNLMVSLRIEGTEKEIPLSEARNLAYDKDPKIRKHAYEQELKSYEKIEDAIAMSISSIKREADFTNGFRGYKSSLEKTLMDSRLSSDTLQAMLNAMKKYLPEFRKYLKKKGESLGHKKGLPFYDLFAPIGESNKTYTYDEAQRIIIDHYASFSPSLMEFAKKAFEQNWIDVEPREGKKGGAFCFNLPFINESRILTNFTGSFSNVSTLAHELGHGYHGQIIAEESPLNRSYPMPLAETASILCETIVMNNLLQTLETSEALYVLENSLTTSTQVIVDILSRYIFESELFDKSSESSLSSKQLQEIMLKAQKEAYGDALDHNTLHPYMWINKPHYYSPELHYYNFPYAFGLLYAKGLFAQFLKDKDVFVKKYDQMLRETGKNTIENVAKMMDIDVTKEDFWIDSLEIIKKEIDQFCELIDKIKTEK